MNGARYEPAKILTHYESEYGAAPKIEMPRGQLLSFIDPEYSTGRWLAVKGTVEGNRSSKSAARNKTFASTVTGDGCSRKPATHIGSPPTATIFASWPTPRRGSA